MKIFSLFFSFFLLLACQSSTNTPTTVTNIVKEVITSQKEIIPPPENRIKILDALKQKTAEGKPLVAHILVALCDNDNQGIVPVSKTLGNGMNLSSNLYWGALYGIKTHLKKSKDWIFLESIPKEREKNRFRILTGLFAHILHLKKPYVARL